MTEDLVIDYSEPWQETGTFLRLQPGPQVSTPPTDKSGVGMRHHVATASRNLSHHPKDARGPVRRQRRARSISRPIGPVERSAPSPLTLQAGPLAQIASCNCSVTPKA